MTCVRAGQGLSAYVDGELSGREALAVRAHVAQCPQCAAERDRLIEIKQALEAMPSLEPPPGLEARLKAAVRAEAATRRQTRVPALAGIGACAVAGAALAMIALANADPSRRPLAPVSQPPIAAVDSVADQAYVIGSDPLGGATPVLPASFGGR